MKHLINNLLLTALILVLSTTVVSAQHNMNHSAKDSTKKVQNHMMMDSTNHMNHEIVDSTNHMNREMMDSTKMHHMKLESSKMMKMDDTKQTMNMDNKIWNAVCPVKGGEVDPETPTVEYMGKTIGFCCPGCDSKFQADPEKYMKKFTEDGKLKMN